MINRRTQVHYHSNLKCVPISSTYSSINFNLPQGHFDTFTLTSLVQYLWTSIVTIPERHQVLLFMSSFSVGCHIHPTDIQHTELDTAYSYNLWCYGSVFYGPARQVNIPVLPMGSKCSKWK